MKAAAFCVAALLVAAPLAFAESMDDKNTDIAAAPSSDTPKNLQYLDDPIGNVQALKDAFLPHAAAANSPLVTPPPTTTGGPVTSGPATSTPTPPTTTAAPTTLSNYLPTNVSLSLGSQYGPYVEQAGITANFPNNTMGPLALTGAVTRYLAIGDWGRVGEGASLGQPQCSATTFGGNNYVQGGDQQKQTALLADQVCALVGGCNAIISTGDNFYQCGVYPQDTTNRFFTDYQQIYQTPSTPNLQNLKWYSTFGNHDIVINGSVQQQIQFTNNATSGGKWQMPSTYFSTILPGAAGGPSIQATFVDTNPFIIAYNSSTSKYHSPYYVANSNPTYIANQQTFVNTALSTSTATYNLVVGHYPIYGTGTQYGKDAGAYPGIYNGWANLLSSIYSNNVSAYINGHDHTMSVGNPQQPNVTQPWNNYTSFLTTGAGSWGETGDTCGKPGSYLYSNGGDGGFFIISANATQIQYDYFVLGSLYSQCTITSFADKTKQPTASPNCALGQPNACCAAGNCY